MLLAMIINKIKSIFHKEKWPNDKDIRFVISAKGKKEGTIMYLSQEQFNTLIGMINIGCQVVKMPMMVAMMEPQITNEFIQ